MSKIPRGWSQTTLESVCDVVRGITFPASGKESAAADDNVCCLRTANVQREIDWDDVYFVSRDFVKRDEQFVRLGDILMSMANSYELVGKVAVVRSLPFATAYGAFLSAVRPTGAVLGQYLFHFLRSDVVQRTIREGSSQTTNIANISISTLSKIAVPLAPLAEQKRIADKLDSLLSRVDSCRERLDRVPAILSRFRQSVLAAATSGKLTEQWRAKNRNTLPYDDHVAQSEICIPASYKRLTKQEFRTVQIRHNVTSLPPTWSIHTIAELYESNVLIDFADGNHGGLYPRKEEFGDQGVLFLTAMQVGERWEIDLSSCPRLNAEKASQLVKGWAKNGDVLLSHNATVGRVALVEDSEENILLGTSLTFYRFNSEYIDPRFARIVFSSRFFQAQLESCMEQTTRNQVPITRQVSLHFVCPPIEEQQEIARRVDSLLSMSNGLLNRVEDAGACVESLTPAVLAKAFRGELVPQDPNDEPANVLLERIRDRRKALDSKIKTITNPKTEKGPKRMKKITLESLSEHILELPEQSFSFEQLRQKVNGNYEDIKNVVFKLLENNEIGLIQYFDETAKEMRFTRAAK